MTLLPTSRKALAWKSRGATITPPPMQSTVPKFSISAGFPKGPNKSRMWSPSFNFPSCLVVLPTSWQTTVIVPFSTSASAIVSGILSPCSSILKITNCPGFVFAAISLAENSNRLMWGTSSRFVTIFILYKLVAAFLNP